LSYPDTRNNINPDLLQELLEQQVISQTTYNTALKHLPKPQWREWLQQMLLLLGVSLFLAGVIFFFAYNWAEMTSLYKFAILQGALILFAGLSHYFGRKKLSGQVCLSGCVILTGVLMAVFGQIYQTGADSYELFMNWAILTIGLVIYSRFTGLWLIWLGIVTTAVLLFWDQVAAPIYTSSFDSCFLILAVLYSVILLLFETGFHKQLAWLQNRWLPLLLLTALFIFLTIPVFNLIFTFKESTFITWTTGIIWIFTTGCTYLWYRHKQPEFMPLFLMATTICVVIVAFLSKLIFEFIFNAHIEEGVFLLSGFVILGCVGTTAMWLKKIHLSLCREIQL
jgi:uncharacterized membrane protein